MSSPSSSPSSSRPNSTNSTSSTRSVSSNASRRSSSNLTNKEMEDYIQFKRQARHNNKTRPRSKSVGAVPSSNNTGLRMNNITLAKELAEIERTKPQHHKGGYKKTKTNKTKTKKSKKNKSKKSKSKTKNRH